MAEYIPGIKRQMPQNMTFQIQVIKREWKDFKIVNETRILSTKTVSIH